MVSQLDLLILNTRDLKRLKKEIEEILERREQSKIIEEQMS